MSNKRERGTGSILTRPGTKVLYLQYRVNGRTIRESSGTTIRQEAEALLREHMVDVSRGATPASDLRKLTYEDLRKALLDHYETKGRKSLDGSDESRTTPGLPQLDAFFAGKTVAQITTDAARTFARKRLVEFSEARKTEPFAGNAIINRSLAVLKYMLRLAYQEGKISKLPYIEMLQEPPARTGFLKLEQFNHLLGHLEKTYRPLATFLYYCGVRLGEALSIDWSQVELEPKPLIRLESDQTKSGYARYVPLPDVLVRMLEPQPRGKLFPVGRMGMWHAWKRACKAAGTEGLLIHDLRRSAARNLRLAGVPETVIMKIGGWRTRAIFDRYNIVDEADVTNAMERLEKKNGHTLKPAPRKQLQA